MSKFDLAAKIAAKLADVASSAPKEQKMLQGMYRGYAGGYDTAKAAIDSGLIYATPQRAAAEAYAANRAKQAAKRGVDDTPHVEMLMVDPFAGRRYGHSTLGSGATPPLRTLAGEYTPEQIESVTNLYAQGGPVNKPQGMEHTRSEGQDASTQPLTGSALKALVRGWIAGTAGLPGDIEGLARKGVNWSFGPGGVNVDEAPALPTSEFYKDWLPGKQQGDEMINDIGSVFGGVGATKPVSLTKGALSRVAAAAPGPMAGSRAAMRGVIKAPGGNWLSGSVEDALNGLKRGDFEAIAQLQRVRPGLSVEEARAFIQAPPPSAENVALNNFVDKQLTRYVQKDMATERDPIRALAERGVLHYDPRAPSQTYQDMVIGKRVKEGFPAEGSSASDLARRYEMASDRAVTNGTYRDNRRFGASLEDDLRKLGGDYAIQNPDAKAYGFDRGVSAGRDLGFDHLMDELRNAVNINSGLPAHLRLDPESLARVSVPQAVERVAKINDWRAAQKVAADQALANNAATVLHKDYPGKGFKWVELSAGERPTGPAGAEYLERKKMLQDALKYEGDTMGHCVGGYCDDVASGKSRIYSLRDAKGQPHTTIEVKPTTPGDQLAHDLETGFDGSELHPRIIQIKGKSNKKPNDEYLPYVQDFVKSGKWGDVGDLRNTGLVKHPSGYLTQEELQALGQAPQGFASGGSVRCYADGGSVRNALNAAVGGSGLVKAVGNTERAVGNIASGNASLGDLKSLRDMASQLGYTVPGLSQALGIAGVAKAGYNMASDPSGMNAAKLAATVNPIAAQALGLYQAATDPTPGTLVDAVSSFNPIARAYNGLANSFNFATIGQVMANLGKIADPNAPAQLRDMFSNNPNSAANAREANEMAARLGIDPMDAMMRVLNADEAAVPGPTVADAINAYNQAQALQTNPSLNPASPDFMGPQADGGSEGGSGGYGYGGLGGIGGMG